MNKNKMNSNSDKRNLKENNNSFWKKFNEKWLGVNIGCYIVGIILFWWLFFIGIINLMRTIFLTILNLLVLPVIYYFFNYFKGSKHQTIIIKIVLVGCGALALGVPIWFFIGYTLIMAPRAPLNNLPDVLRGRILILVVLSSYGLATYIMYRIGKKREWRPPYFFILT